MGTLYDQPVRNHRTVDTSDIVGFLKEIVVISGKAKLPNELVMQAFLVKELARFNDLYVDNGDTFDEQMTGIGKELHNLIESIRSLHSDETN